MVSEQVPKNTKVVVTLKNRVLRKFSKGYHVYIPSAFVDDSELLKVDKTYDLIFLEK